MKIKLKKKENSYAQVHKNMLYSKFLSLKAKGLGSILEAYSNDYDVSLKSIELNGKDGIKSLRSAISELENQNFLFRFQSRDDGGLFTTFWIFDSQILDLNYINDIVKEYETVIPLTINKLLEKLLILNGVSVTGIPSRITYNNSNLDKHLIETAKYFLLGDGRVERHRHFFTRCKQATP